MTLQLSRPDFHTNTSQTQADYAPRYSTQVDPKLVKSLNEMSK